ncbi:hypothetical protein AMS68_005088 [Peltaster fructicola]|uniref:Major facilitator superfamily (MFS) profile domain-containing protein n=1 Tax=Peltaster fructicola TaxID=286661 RepID=A0A6H0XY27_9PEZI|nr:hypothetical protein AMS68_005088 [Peltaster fructicola]
MKLRSLRDLDNSEGTVQLHSSFNSSLVLHPAPNPSDPNDPLRWPQWKKGVSFFSVCAFAFLANFAIGGLAPAFYILSLEFNKTQTETSALLLWPILVLGIFNFFWVPLANYIGKRPVFIFACLLLCVCYIWGAVAQTFESLLWSNIIAAFAGSSTEALGAAVVNDLYFVHERANAMSWYMIAISGGNTVGPLICGFVVERLGWRWHKWIAVILVAVNWLLVVFFFPETRYDRSSIAESGASTPIDADEKTIATRERQVSELPKKTFAQELNPWSGTSKDASLLELFIRPWPLIVYPAVVYAFLAYAVTLAWVVAVNILNSFILQAPPYKWSPSINGLINIAGIIGNLIGAFAGGWCVDRYSDWRSKKNGGVFQPESRLHMMWIPTIIVMAGCLTWGYAQAESLSWVALFFSFGMIAFGLTYVPVTTMTYVSDSYLPVNADALMLVNGLKNIVAFGFLYGIVPWVTTAGPVNAFGAQAGIYVAILALAIPLVLFGAKLRHITAHWRIIL